MSGINERRWLPYFTEGVAQAVRSLEKDKTTGFDKVPADLIKHREEVER
jgi:hypothetical protein